MDCRAQAAALSRRTLEVPSSARRSPGSAVVFMSGPHRTGQGSRRDCKGGQDSSNAREITFKRKEKTGTGGRGEGGRRETGRQKGRSHARDGRSAAALKVVAPLSHPVLGRGFQNRLKSDALVFCKALFRVRSISINYLFELFSQGGGFEQPSGRD